MSAGTAGDVNGDGYSDLIVGAPLYDNGQADEGKAWVFLGGPDGPGLSAWTTEGNQATAYWGVGLAPAGDVNGDGYDDFLVSSPYYDTAAGAGAGKVAFFLGSPAGPSTTPDWTLEGAQSGGALGTSVAGAGDVNGDGYADVLIGQHLYSNGQTWEGRALLFFGSPSGLGATPDWTAESNRYYGSMGVPVASAGDVDGDGYADVIIGAPGAVGCGCAGQAYLYRGSPTGLSSTPDWSVIGVDGYQWLGSSAGSAGDVNGDGYSDVFVSEYGYNSERGRVYVWLGSAAGMGPQGTPSNAAWTAESDGDSERFGYNVTGAGDVNGDGYSDLLVGAPRHSNGETWEGRACLYLGSPGGLAPSAAWSVESDQAEAYLGYSVSGAGDLNGDGYGDVITGGYGFDGAAGADCGIAWAFNGSATGLGTTPSWSAEGSQAGEYLGVKMAGAGDVNGDGFADFLADAESYSNGETEEGRVALYLGGAGGGGGGRALKPQQRRYDDSAPIVQLGKSETRDGFRLAALGRTPFGRGKARLQTEVKPYGTAFDGTGLQSSAWTDTGTAGASLTNVVASLPLDGGYHWRARLLYEAAGLPWQPGGRWFGPPDNGWTEMDLRLMPREADIAVSSFTDSPDPVFNLQNLTYSLAIVNAGPDSAEASASVVLSPTGVGVTFVPGSSDARWSWNSSSKTLSASVGSLAGGGSTTLVAVFKVSGEGTVDAEATVTSSADPNPANNNASATSTVTPLALGDRIWRDDDGDGIQDAGEPGLSGVVVDLYDASYSWLARRLTDPSGAFSFSGLAYGSTYLVKFFLPSADYVFSPRDQGTDDTLDSDADAVTGQTVPVALTDGLDPTRWDCGMVPGALCIPPDEPLYIYSVTLTSDGNHYPVLNFMDPNQPSQVTGYNVYRTSNPALPHGEWPKVASDVVDMDEGSPNKQWVDTSETPPPEGQVWYYEVSGYNHHCSTGAEGPW